MTSPPPICRAGRPGPPRLTNLNDWSNAIAGRGRLQGRYFASAALTLPARGGRLAARTQEHANDARRDPRFRPTPDGGGLVPLRARGGRALLPAGLRRSLPRPDHRTAGYLPAAEMGSAELRRSAIRHPPDCRRPGCLRDPLRLRLHNDQDGRALHRRGHVFLPAARRQDRRVLAAERYPLRVQAGSGFLRRQARRGPYEAPPMSRSASAQMRATIVWARSSPDQE